MKESTILKDLTAKMDVVLAEKAEAKDKEAKLLKIENEANTNLLEISFYLLPIILISPFSKKKVQITFIMRSNWIQIIQKRIITYE